LGPPTGQQQSWALYSGAAVGGLQVVLGSVVLLGQGPGTQPGLVQCLWQDDAGRKRAQVRVDLWGVLRGELICHSAAGEREGGASASAV
jgi:hypothetical protein